MAYECSYKLRFSNLWPNHASAISQNEPSIFSSLAAQQTFSLSPTTGKQQHMPQGLKSL